MYKQMVVADKGCDRAARHISSALLKVPLVAIKGDKHWQSWPSGLMSIRTSLLTGRSRYRNGLPTCSCVQDELSCAAIVVSKLRVKIGQ